MYFELNNDYNYSFSAHEWCNVNAEGNGFTFQNNSETCNQYAISYAFGNVILEKNKISKWKVE